MPGKKGYHGEKPEDYFRPDQPTTPPIQSNRNGTAIQDESGLNLQKFDELMASIIPVFQQSNTPQPPSQQLAIETSDTDPLVSLKKDESPLIPVMKGYLYQIKYAVCQKGKAAIYILVEPDTKEIRFVGRSETPAGSYALHIASARNSRVPNNEEISRDSLQAWIRSLENQGKFPEIYVIEETNLKTIIQRERTIISQLKKHGVHLLTDMEKKPSGLYTLEEMQYIAKAYGGACLSNTYVSLREPLQWICLQAHQWTQSADCTLKGQWCRQCDSLLEKEKGKQAFQELRIRRSVLALNIVGYTYQRIARQKKLDPFLVKDIIDQADI